MGLDWSSQKLWLLSSFLFWAKQESVLSKLGWAVTATGEELEIQGIVASVTPQALKHLHWDFTTGQEKLLLCLEPWSSGLCCWVALQGAGWQLLGSSGTSTPATNKLNWMLEAFIIWHRGAPSGFICLLQKQNVWPHAAPSHETALLLLWPILSTLKSYSA